MSDQDHWEARFAGDDYLFGTAPNAFVARSAGRLPAGGRVLSVADGEGRNGVFLAEQGFSVVSQELSPTAQAKARRLAAERGVALVFEHSDLRVRDWEAEAFDGIVGIFFQFLTPEERGAIFARIGQALKPGGLLLIEGYGPRQLEFATGGPKALANLYTPELLREAFAGFAEVEVWDYEAELAEGRHHVGRSALVDLVARK